MKWRSYLIFGPLSLVVSALSVVLWMINPFTDLLLLLACATAAPLRLSSAGAGLVGSGKRYADQLSLATYPLAIALAQFPTVTLEKVGGTPVCFCWETCLSPRWC